MGLLWGVSDKITCIQDIALKGAQNEDLCLGYMTSTLFLGGGVYLKDKGFVLGIKSAHGSYYPMPSDQEIAEFQSAALLPTPLPAYHISPIDYLFGYSLWIVIGVTMVWYGMTRLFSGRKRKANMQNLAPVAEQMWQEPPSENGR